MINSTYCGLQLKKGERTSIEMINKKYDVIIVGGGASGFFTAISLAEQNTDLKIAILERGKEVLSKVRISGGGRCNVTHACFIPNLLTKYYPRGERELRGPFHTFCTGDVIEWFEQKGIELKTEEDGRMFPVTDSSQTIIDCFVSEAKKLDIEVIQSCSVQHIFQNAEQWKLDTTQGAFSTKNLVLATGSNPKVWEMLAGLNHEIILPVPSLFTFNIKDSRIKELMGLSVEHVTVKVADSKLKATGPLLITHWGMSGPAVLRLSAWGARDLSEMKYRFQVHINWLNDKTFDDTLQELLTLKETHAKKNISKFSPFPIPGRLWEQLVLAAGISLDTKWSDTNKKQLVHLTHQLTDGVFSVDGKSTFKEEFVTAGGVDLKQINFKTMESKLFHNLYFTGEIINIDAITGGFNFQNAWTTGFIAAQAIANK